MHNHLPNPVFFYLFRAGSGKRIRGKFRRVSRHLRSRKIPLRFREKRQLPHVSTPLTETVSTLRRQNPKLMVFLPASGSSRRLSARMGVVATNQSATASAKSSTNKAPLATPRRQTLTGIRTSYKSPHYENVKSVPSGNGMGSVASRRKSTNISTTPGSRNKRAAMTDENAMVAMQTPTSAGGRVRKLKAAEVTTSRRKSKRFMTIGYEGEVGRSPLMERQNIVVTVQRSKSAQTPIGKTAIVKKDLLRQNEVRNTIEWLRLQKDTPLSFINLILNSIGRKS